MLQIPSEQKGYLQMRNEWRDRPIGLLLLKKNKRMWGIKIQREREKTIYKGRMNIANDFNEAERERGGVEFLVFLWHMTWFPLQSKERELGNHTRLN